MLKVRDLVVAYGGIEALKGISIDVPEGQIVTLIGANGAGKRPTGRGRAPCCAPSWDWRNPGAVLWNTMKKT